MFGHPVWGKLNYGYGFVGRSNSATFTHVLLCKSGVGIRGGLTLDQVHADSPCGQAMADLEERTIRIYEKSALALEDMRKNPPGYLDAVTTYEKDIIELNREFGDPLTEPIIAVYPQDGMIVPTHPFAILDGAPWVTSEQAEAAAVFQRFLLSKEQQSRLVDNGFRPTDPTEPLRDPIVRRNGADPQAHIEPIEMPDRPVIDKFVEIHGEIRKSPK